MSWNKRCLLELGYKIRLRRRVGWRRCSAALFVIDLPISAVQSSSRNAKGEQSQQAASSAAAGYSCANGVRGGFLAWRWAPITSSLRTLCSLQCVAGVASRYDYCKCTIANVGTSNVWCKCPTFSVSEFCIGI